MADKLGAKPGDLVAFGHTHRPWQRSVEGIHFVNTGSVGRPKDGDPRAGYVRVTVEHGRALSVGIVRVAYDVARAARGIRACELPDAFARHLEQGGTGTGAA